MTLVFKLYQLCQRIPSSEIIHGKVCSGVHCITRKVCKFPPLCQSLLFSVIEDLLLKGDLKDDIVLSFYVANCLF